MIRCKTAVACVLKFRFAEIPSKLPSSSSDGRSCLQACRRTSDDFRALRERFAVCCNSARGRQDARRGAARDGHLSQLSLAAGPRGSAARVAAPSSLMTSEVVVLASSRGRDMLRVLLLWAVSRPPICPQQYCCGGGCKSSPIANKSTKTWRLSTRWGCPEKEAPRWPLTPRRLPLLQLVREPRPRQLVRSDKFDAAAGTITISHGPVASLNCPAMTMGFKATPDQIASVEVGQKVSFAFNTSGKDSTITTIKSQ